MENDVKAAGGEFVLLYFSSLSCGEMLLDDVSATMDAYGFSSSWRITDSVMSTIENASENGNWLFNYFPSGWIVNTKTMEMVASSEWGPSFEIIDIINSI